jgi:hypothetical protein
MTLDRSRTDFELDIADDFWAATALDETSADRFVRRLTSFEPADDAIHPLSHSGPMTPLDPVRDRFQRRLETRRSGRVFSGAPLPARSVTRLLAATGVDSRKRRVVPSAGGLDAVSTYAIGHNVVGPCNRRVVRYDADAHAVNDVGPLPADAELHRLLSLEPTHGIPPLTLVFVAHLRDLRRKYGARGDRFALVETGCAAQNVELRLANDGLVGYQLGGVHDALIEHLGLSRLPIRITGAVACGA